MSKSLYHILIAILAMSLTSKNAFSRPGIQAFEDGKIELNQQILINLAHLKSLQTDKLKLIRKVRRINLFHRNAPITVKSLNQKVLVFKKQISNQEDSLFKMRQDRKKAISSTEFLEIKQEITLQEKKLADLDTTNKIKMKEIQALIGSLTYKRDQKIQTIIEKYNLRLNAMRIELINKKRGLRKLEYYQAKIEQTLQKITDIKQGSDELNNAISNLQGQERDTLLTFQKNAQTSSDEASL